MGWNDLDLGLTLLFGILAFCGYLAVLVRAAYLHERLQAIQEALTQYEVDKL